MAALRASTCSGRQVELLPRYNEEKKQDVSDEKIAQWNVSMYGLPVSAIFGPLAYRLMQHRLYYKTSNPNMGGLQRPALGAQLAMEPEAGEFIQILCIHNSHWICVSTVGCQPSMINVFDSMQATVSAPTLPLHITVVYFDLFLLCLHDISAISFFICPSRFTVAFATSICCGVDPMTVAF